MERLTVDDMKSIELEIMDEIDCVCCPRCAVLFRLW